MDIDATALCFSALNEQIRACGGKCRLYNCLGQRFIAAGMDTADITIDGIPGNALGAYLCGGQIVVNGNAQDAVGDTMDDGKIIVHGSIGDAAGYAMRGGEIWIQGNAGYRAGIHMKEYREKRPLLVIGGHAGSFLGEYQAGGVIVVLGLSDAGRPIVGDFPCTGMHGGRLYIRGDADGIDFPAQTKAHPAAEADMACLRPILEQFYALFGGDREVLFSSPYTVVTPDSQNPYKQMYVAN